MRIPRSTYRLQFGRGLGFREARELAPYLQQLGVSDIYASPIFHAHSDSASGYDIVDPTRLSPALGSTDDFTAFCGELQRRDMGLLLDIVPNHMSANSSNLWWRDVLENGISSQYSRYFDIEWDTPTHLAGGKMLWPVLGAPYAEVLERSELVLTISEDGFSAQYFERTLPIDPATYGVILAHAQSKLTADGDLSGLTELAGLFHALPPSTTTDAEEARRRRCQIRQLKRRLWDLYRSDERIRSLLDESIRTFNGEPGDPRSFDLLETLLGQQPYALSLWRVAREKINYRRFFDITDLVAVNVEEPEVFAATHSLIFRLVDEGLVTGLRVDHIDGLYDPTEYLLRLRARLPDCYIVVEKILQQKESLNPQWPVAGTTGYDFINAAGSVTLDPEGAGRITEAYRHIAASPATFPDVVYEQRKGVIERLFIGEAHSLGLHLNLLADSDRYAKDASPQELYAALVEVTACLPVYRTYTRSFQIAPDDFLHIEQAFQEARRRNPRYSETIWGFIRRVLLLECPPNLTPDERARWRQFVQRWQQFSGPVMAKGQEDTAFYIYNRLISMNEVGCQDQPWSLQDFHGFAEERAKRGPNALNAGTTHDTKRGEDARARIHVLAQMTGKWLGCVKRWRRWNARCKGVLNGVPVPDGNEEYFIYQTLAGAWPLDAQAVEAFPQRLHNALVKSWREAKVHTSWSKPDEGYERAAAGFVAAILTAGPENRFLPDFVRFHRRVAAAGAFLSLSQTVVRFICPGVPDIYNGAELWDLSLVDPDNRSPVDFAKRRDLLDGLDGQSISALLKNWQNGAVKQYVCQKMLACRRQHPNVFSSGEYIPLETTGSRASYLVAFARHEGMTWIVAVAPLFPARLSASAAPPLGKRPWANTEVRFPQSAPRRWTNVFTHEHLTTTGPGGIAAASLLRRFPVALLVARPD